MIDFKDVKRMLDDGIWIVSDDCVVQWIEAEVDCLNSYPEALVNAEAFAKAYPDFVVASTYEVYGFFLLSKRPKRLPKLAWRGSGFNYGACAIIENCPKRLLILAEND